MDLADDGGSRFEGYVDGLASVIGHKDREGLLRDYCLGLMLPCERKSVEPLAAVTKPARVAAQIAVAFLRRGRLVGPSSTIRILSYAEKCHRVARRMRLIIRSAGSFVGTAHLRSLKGYDEPEILPPSTYLFCLMSADGEHPPGLNVTSTAAAPLLAGPGKNWHNPTRSAYVCSSSQRRRTTNSSRKYPM